MKNSIIFLVSLLLFSSIVTHAETLIIRYPTKKDAFHDAASTILKEAYLSIGVNVEYRVIPSARSLVLSNSGNIDGELVRIGSIAKTYTNLVKVPVSHVAAEQMAWAVEGSGMSIVGWESLRPYKIVFHRGYKAAESGTKGMNIETVNSVKQAFQMVSLGRKDVAIANKFTGLSIIKNWELSKKIVMLKPAVQVDPLYHYLHKKHQALVPKITTAMNKMKKSGRFEEIYKQFKL